MHTNLDINSAQIIIVNADVQSCMHNYCNTQKKFSNPATIAISFIYKSTEYQTMHDVTTKPAYTES